MPGFFEFHEKLHAKPEAPAPAKTPNALTVSQLTQQIERALREKIPPTLLVRGEVSNWNHHRQSGHAYFTLKDPSNCIDCVMFKDNVQRLKFKPGDGMELLAGGQVRVYGARGKYQLYVSTLQPLGQGALELAFQQLKAKLEKEGLFAEERKKPLPTFPLRIALVTSRHTAALQDMFKVLRHFPHLKVFIYHVPVQGEGAAERIATAIDALSRHHQSLGIELAILARGGGSLEDLWQFNEEVIARAIAKSALPVITGIGHEVDVSIADLVADYHAHTPTEAARVVTANWREIAETLSTRSARLHREMRNIVSNWRNRILSIARHESFRRPMDLVNIRRQRVDDLQRSLHHEIHEQLREMHRRIHDLAQRLDRQRPSAILVRRRETLRTLERRLALGANTRLRKAHERSHYLDLRLQRQHPSHSVSLAQQRINNLESLLKAYNPTNVLQRGYSITSLKKGGKVVRSATDLKEGDEILTRFADGSVESTVEDQNQGKLF